MKLEEYRESLLRPASPRTVTFLIRNDEVLLGFKKRGFGKGIYTGIGGKLEEKETPEQAAIREIMEEIECTVVNLREAGTVAFFFPHVKDDGWNQKGFVYTTAEFEGKPHETEEIKPEWFKITELPLDRMWDDAQYWLPRVLSGEVIEDEFLYDQNYKVAEHVAHTRNK